MREHQEVFHHSGEQLLLGEECADERVAELERVWRRMALDLGYCSERRAFSPASTPEA
jgi:hypothetical protein